MKEDLRNWSSREGLKNWSSREGSMNLNLKADLKSWSLT
jgi:hypothetical protein